MAFVPGYGVCAGAIVGRGSSSVPVRGIAPQKCPVMAGSVMFGSTLASRRITSRLMLLPSSTPSTWAPSTRGALADVVVQADAFEGGVQPLEVVVHESTPGTRVLPAVVMEKVELDGGAVYYICVPRDQPVVLVKEDGIDDEMYFVVLDEERELTQLLPEAQRVMKERANLTLADTAAVLTLEGVQNEPRSGAGHAEWDDEGDVLHTEQDPDLAEPAFMGSADENEVGGHVHDESCNHDDDDDGETEMAEIIEEFEFGPEREKILICRSTDSVIIIAKESSAYPGELEIPGPEELERVQPAIEKLLDEEPAFA